jgi:hypothetical protein
LVWKWEISKLSPERPSRKLKGHVPDSSFLIWMILIIITNQNKAAYQKSTFYLVWKGEILKLSPERPSRKLRGHILGSLVDLFFFYSSLPIKMRLHTKKSALYYVCK